MNYFFPGFGLLLLTLALGTLTAFQLGVLNEDEPQASLPNSTLIQAPVLPPKPSAISSRRVFLIIVDGLTQHDIPQHSALDQFAKRCTQRSATPGYPSFAYPGLLSILSGTTPDRHGIRSDATRLSPAVDTLLNNELKAHLYTQSEHIKNILDSQHTSFLSANNTTLQANTILTSKHPLNIIHIDTLSRTRTRHHTPYTHTTFQPPSTPLLTTLLQNIDLTQHTVFLTSSHGYTSHGGYGGREDQERHLPLLLAGPGLKTPENLPETPVHIASIAPTIAYLLHTQPPRDASQPPLFDTLDTPHIHAFKTHWNLTRTLYERAWLDHIYTTWTKPAWDGTRIGNSVSQAALSAPKDAPLETLLKTRTHVYDEIQRDRRVGRTPAIALLAAILLMLTAAGLLFSYRLTPLLASIAFPSTALVFWTSLSLPFSFSASPSLLSFLALSLCTAALALTTYLAALFILTRSHPQDRRTEARRFHIALASTFFAFLTFSIWLLQGYQPTPPFPSPELFFAPLWLGSITTPFTLFATLFWIGSVHSQKRTQPNSL